MRAYRFSVNLKLGLIVFAVLIAVASVWYTNRLAQRLGEREEANIQLWAEALAQLPKTARTQAGNPYQKELRGLENWLARLRRESASGELPAPDQLERFRQAVLWAQGMPPTGELNFITNEIIVSDAFRVPAIVTDSATQEPILWRNLEVPSPERLEKMPPEKAKQVRRQVQRRSREMDAAHPTIPIQLPGITQQVHYGESALIRELRYFPYVQLLFLALFIGVGYLGFSYVRRSEQSSLWVGMAKEAAHQLGTPISSLMGWTQYLRMPDLPPEKKDEALTEIENDIKRLQRVANRFSDIGSQPKLEEQPVTPLLEETASYVRRRLPSESQAITLRVDAEENLRAPVNAELFGWVVENLLKNALDAINEEEGEIVVRAHRTDDAVRVDVRDTGAGVERRQRRNVFRPGYSTKKRGWGLGLSLAKRIVEDYHGGSLTLAESVVGEGSTFRIEVPVG
jgi:signal transduction histidine kinase